MPSHHESSVVNRASRPIRLVSMETNFSACLRHAEYSAILARKRALLLLNYNPRTHETAAVALLLPEQALSMFVETPDESVGNCVCTIIVHHRRVSAVSPQRESVAKPARASRFWQEEPSSNSAEREACIVFWSMTPDSAGPAAGESVQNGSGALLRL